MYSDGTVVKWLKQVSDFFMADAGITIACALRSMRHAANIDEGADARSPQIVNSETVSGWNRGTQCRAGGGGCPRTTRGPGKH